MAKSQTVFIVGATGKTGSSIVNSLLGDPKFEVIAAIRPASASKPGVESLKARGAQIRLVDPESSSVEQLQEHLAGVDIVISALEWTQIDVQTVLIRAANAAGVKRFVPSDWGTACVPGVRDLFDQKIKCHDLIKELGLDYTFIDVGWWYQVTLPIIEPAKALYPGSEDLINTIFGTGNVKTSLTDNRDIGKFVARIISDDRTLNKYVFCWAEEYTQNEVLALAERIVGKTILMKKLSVEDLSIIINGFAPGTLEHGRYQYFNSVFVRGDNTVHNAKKAEYGGALDARELYPDIKLTSLESFAREYYSQ